MRATLTLIALFAAAGAAAQPPVADPVGRANAAIAAQDWPTAETLLKALIVQDPKWRYYAALGDAEFHQGRYVEALAAYNQAEPGGRAESGASAEAGGVFGRMLVNEGGADIAEHRLAAAQAAYRLATEVDPGSGLAWFNLCATAYNMGDADTALEACDVTIRVAPDRPEAWFIKASALMNLARAEKGPAAPPPAGMAEALRRYLDLAPDGPHAEDARRMLAYATANR